MELSLLHRVVIILIKGNKKEIGDSAAAGERRIHTSPSQQQPPLPQPLTKAISQ